MEGSSPKSPLLVQEGRRASRRRVLSRRNSVNSLWTEFVTRLPDKVRSGLSGLDPESTSFDPDFSRTKGLTKGTYVSTSNHLKPFFWVTQDLT
jgi:hypothetical protein